MQPAYGFRRGLVPPEPDGCDEFVAAVVARPDVADTAFEVEFGLFGHQQNEAAARAIGPAEVFSRGAKRGVLCAAGRLDGHRRFLLDAPLQSPNARQFDQRMWRCCDAFMKLSWRR
jgi:hypothetical protein